MIGGIVLETIILPDSVWVNCVENNSTSKCAIYVERNAKSEAIKPADTVWWQGGSAMWTPYDNIKKDSAKCGKDYDIRIPKISGSGVSRPDGK